MVQETINYLLNYPNSFVKNRKTKCEDLFLDTIFCSKYFLMPVPDCLDVFRFIYFKLDSNMPLILLYQNCLHLEVNLRINLLISNHPFLHQGYNKKSPLQFWLELHQIYEFICRDLVTGKHCDFSLVQSLPQEGLIVFISEEGRDRLRWEKAVDSFGSTGQTEKELITGKWLLLPWTPGNTLNWGMVRGWENAEKVESRD